MQIKRLIVGLLVAGLAGITPLAVGAPAHAVASYATTTKITISVQKAANSDYYSSDKPTARVQYGDIVSVSGSVSSNGGTPYNGRAWLQRATTSNPTWSNVAVVDHFGFFYFENLKVTENTVFRVVYTGYNGGTTDDTYGASTSSNVVAGVEHKVGYRSRTGSLLLHGKVTPHYKGKIVKIKVKKSGHWVRYKRVRTDRYGKFAVKFYAHRGRTIKFLVLVPAYSKMYLDNGRIFTTHAW